MRQAYLNACELALYKIFVGKHGVNQTYRNLHKVFCGIVLSLFPVSPGWHKKNEGNRMFQCLNVIRIFQKAKTMNR